MGQFVLYPFLIEGNNNSVCSSSSRLWRWLPIPHRRKVCPRFWAGGRGLLPLHRHRFSMQTERGLLPLLLLRVPLCGRFLWGLQWSPDEAWAGPSWAHGSCVWSLRWLLPLPQGDLPPHWSERPFQPLWADQSRCPAGGLWHWLGLWTGLLDC